MKTLIAITLLLASCAAPVPPPPVQERFLSQEEDAEFRSRCEETGCVVIPVPLWLHLLNRLKQQGV